MTHLGHVSPPTGISIWRHVDLLVPHIFAMVAGTKLMPMISTQNRELMGSKNLGTDLFQISGNFCLAGIAMTTAAEGRVPMSKVTSKRARVLPGQMDQEEEKGRQLQQCPWPFQPLCPLLVQPRQGNRQGLHPRLRPQWWGLVATSASSGNPFTGLGGGGPFGGPWGGHPGRVPGRVK